MTVSRQQALDVVLAVHGAESCCTPSDLLADRVTICERRADRLTDPNHRKFPRWEPDFGIVSLGQGAVVSASAGILDWVRDVFAEADRDAVFEVGRLGQIADKVAGSGQRLLGPVHLFAVSSTDLRAVPPPAGVRVTVEGPEFASHLIAHDWPHSLPEGPGRPIRAVAVARTGSSVIGIATAAEDAPRLWQIGIDVTREQRGRGVGKTLTAALGGVVLEGGAVPYYGTALANIPSARTALSAGFWPAWTEVWVKQVPPD
ncbi:MAG: hypothetical protein HY678_06015 [Chloroflexi bacterium]|nr:hypothetical protein [Chloroflexota bacterium]